VRFEEGDANALPYGSDEFDVIVFHTCLTHLLTPGMALAEALRVLRPGCHLAILDGDYSTTSVAIGDNDPLQACTDAAVSALVNDRWLARRLPSLVRSCGFHVERFDSHGYLQESTPDYMFTLIDRGAQTLANLKRIDQATADSLKREARCRVDRGEFFGFIALVSLIARKPEC
jgi:ubiquinone/menaquinone biosynthesis C-methylase UbiE